MFRIVVSVLTTEMIKISADFHEFYDLISYLNGDDQQRVSAALAYAREQHAGQKRKSGEPYILHPVTVAANLAQHHVEPAAIIAALLHDVAEDTSASVFDIGKRFGEDVAQIVDGVTKFESAEQQLDSQTRNQATLAKLFHFTTLDLRVGLIKIFDRLHNMQTIGDMSPAHQEKKARETLTVYAPLANRLGMWHIKNDLESMAFHILNSTQAEEIDRKIDQRAKAHLPILEDVRNLLLPPLEKIGIYEVKFELSPRHAYSIYHKAQEKHLPPLVDNFPRIMIIVRSRHHCYLTLGVIHSIWKHKGNDIHDYVSNPRDNFYRALQTTVLYDGEQEIKFRIRTQDMALTSDLGVLARWCGVKLNDPEIENATKEQLDSFIQSIQHNIEVETEEGEAAKSVVSDILPQQIKVYTPKGEEKTLPKGSTPLDFAYMIHTEVGHSCSRALVNGKNVQLNKPLNDGDRVNITRNNHSPERIWLEEDLGYLRTSYARGCVRRWFQHLSAEEAINQGKTLLCNNLAMIGQSDYPHQRVAEWYGYANIDALYLELGRIKRSVNTVMQKVLADSWLEGQVKRIGRTVTSEAGEKFIIFNADNFEKFSLCRQCRPRPGTPIVGYIVNSSNLVKIHDERCRQLPPETQMKKLLRLRWGEGNSDEVRPIPINIFVYDRQDFLHEMTTLIHDEQLNIASICTHPMQDQKLIKVQLCIEFTSPHQLMRMLYQFKSLHNVRMVRIPPAKSQDDLSAK